MKPYSYYIKRICTRLHKLNMLDSIPTPSEISIISDNLTSINEVLPKLYVLETEHPEMSRKNKIQEMMKITDSNGQCYFREVDCKNIVAKLPRLVNFYQHLCYVNTHPKQYQKQQDKINQAVQTFSKNYHLIQQKIQELLISKQKVLAKFQDNHNIPEQVRVMFQMGGTNTTGLDFSNIGIFDVLTKPLWVVEEIFPPSGKWFNTINTLLQMSDVFIEKLEPIIEFIVPTLELLGERLIDILFDVLQAIPFAGTAVSVITIVLNILEPILEIGNNLLSNLPIIGDNYDSRADKITQRMGDFFTRINMMFNFARGDYGAAIDELFEMLPNGDEISDVLVLLLNGFNAFVGTHLHTIINVINYFIDRITGI